MFPHVFACHVPAYHLGCHLAGILLSIAGCHLAGILAVYGECTVIEDVQCSPLAVYGEYWLIRAEVS